MESTCWLAKDRCCVNNLDRERNSELRGTKRWENLISAWILPGWFIHRLYQRPSWPFLVPPSLFIFRTRKQYQNIPVVWRRSSVLGILKLSTRGLSRYYLQLFKDIMRRQVGEKSSPLKTHLVHDLQHWRKWPAACLQWTRNLTEWTMVLATRLSSQPNPKLAQVLNRSPRRLRMGWIYPLRRQERSSLPESWRSMI